MRTIGIDVASQDARTAICSIRWEDGFAEIEPLGPPGASDDQIHRCIESADRVGVAPSLCPTRCTGSSRTSADTLDHGPGLRPTYALSSI